MNTNYLSQSRGKVSYEQRVEKNGHRGLVVWMTGLSGAGKTTIAVEAEKQLFDMGKMVFRLDGDDVRQGLCAGLGFSQEERAENIRRASEVAALFYRAGFIVLASFISPLQSMRQQARQLVPAGAFLEVFVHAPLQVCRERDPKGFYRRAENGEIPNYTGVASSYEEPQHPDLVLDSASLTLNECTLRLLDTIIDSVMIAE